MTSWWCRTCCWTATASRNRRVTPKVSWLCPLWFRQKGLKKDWNPSWWCISCILQTTERKAARCSNTVLEPAGSAAIQTVAMHNPVAAKEATTPSELQPSRSVLFFNCESLWDFGSEETQIKLLSSYFSFSFSFFYLATKSKLCPAGQTNTVTLNVCSSRFGLVGCLHYSPKSGELLRSSSCQCSRLNISQNDLKVKTCVVNLQHASIQTLAMDKTIMATSASSELHPSRSVFIFFFFF